MTTAKDGLREELKDPEARHDYAEIFGNSSIALQIKALRLQRKWSQEELGKRAGMKQARISAMEQASYSGWNIRTLRRLAQAFDLALVVRFESFGVFLEDVTSANRSRLERPSFEDDPGFSASKPAPDSAAIRPTYDAGHGLAVAAVKPSAVIRGLGPQTQTFSGDFRAAHG